MGGSCRLGSAGGGARRIGLLFLLTGLAGLGGAVARPLCAGDPPAAEEAAAAEAEAKGALAEARKTLVARLVELAEWCVSVRLAGQRDRLAAEILRFDPEHAKARGWLRYTKDKAGTWVQAKGYKPPLDVTNSSQLPELARRRAALGAEPAAQVVTVLQRLGSTLPLRRRELILEELLAISPGDERARALHGDVRDGAGFVLQETMASRERRGALVAEARTLVASVPEPRPVTPTADETEFVAGGWARAYATADLRILGAGVHSSALLTRAIRLGQAARQAFPALLGQDVPDIAGLTFFLYALPFDAYAFFDTSSRMQPSQRAFARNLSCYWMPSGPQVLVYPNDDDTRVEWVPRIVVSGMLEGGFELGPTFGMLFEGVGVWMTTRLCGTHRTFTVRTGDYANGQPRDEGLLGRIRANEADWLVEARGLVAKGIRPDLRFALGKDVNAMTAEDLVFAFALASYLFEARPQQVGPLLKAFPKASMDAAVEGALGMSVEGLEARLVRWLEESVAAPLPPPPPPSNPFGPRPTK